MEGGNKLGGPYIFHGPQGQLDASGLGLDSPMTPTSSATLACGPLHPRKPEQRESKDEQRQNVI